MKKNLKEYIIVFTIIILVGLLLIIIKNNILSLFNEVIDTEWQTGNNEENELIIDDNKNYSINYSDGSYIYNINSYTNENYIYVKKTEIVKCQAIECSYNIVDEYNIYFEGNKLNYIKGFIKSIFNEFGNNTIYETDLNSDELRMMKSIIKNDERYLDNNENVYYELMYETNNGELKAKGYILNKNVEYTSIHIGLGSKSNSGYSLGVKEVKKIDNDIYITVEEIKPNNYDVYMDVIVYPSIGLNIYDDFDNIIVKDTYNNTFHEIIIN